MGTLQGDFCLVRGMFEFIKSKNLKKCSKLQLVFCYSIIFVQIFGVMKLLFFIKILL